MIRTLFFAALLLALPFLNGCTEISAWYHPALTQIRTDLPPGSSPARVDAYLEEHNIDHTYYPRSDRITAIIHNIQRDALVREDLNLVFNFDEYAGLREILAKPAYTQP